MNQTLSDNICKKAQNYEPKMIGFLQKLIQSPSVNGENSEEVIANVILDQANQLHLPVQMISKDKRHPNIYVGNSKNFKSHKELLFISHLDTVPVGNIKNWKYDPFKGAIHNNKLYGRGSADNKSGIAVSLYAMKVLHELGFLQTVKMIALSDEESGADSNFGAKYILSKGLKAKTAIYTYPGVDAIHIGHRGLMRIIVKFVGKNRHTGNIKKNEVTDNPIMALVEFLHALKDEKLTGEHNAFPNYHFAKQPTLIQGGEGESILPATASVLIDIRLLPQQNAKEFINIIIRKARQQETKVIKSTIQIKNNIPAAAIDSAEPIVPILTKLTQEIFGNNPHPEGVGPACEAYLFIQSGISTICGYGPTGGNLHADNEYINIDSLSKALQVYVQAALALQGESKKLGDLRDITQ